MDWLLREVPELDALLYRIIYSRLGKDASAIADDLCQNVYVKLAGRVHNAPPENQIRDVRTYAIRVVINECNDFIANKVRTLRRELSLHEVLREAPAQPCLTIEGGVYCDQLIAADEKLRSMYEHVVQRPVHYRKAFLFTQVDEQGDSLLLRMLTRRVVRPDQICEALVIAPDYLEDLIKQKKLPMDIAVAAKELGVAAHQVCKWRSSTMARWHGGGGEKRHRGRK